MAKLAGMIDCFSGVLGMPRTAVEAYVKPLRKAGLIASSGRTGPGSPDMTAQDAANLLIAILCGSTTHALERAIECGSYELAEPGRRPKHQGSRHATLDLLSLGRNHNFFDLAKSLFSADFDDLNSEKIGKVLKENDIQPSLYSLKEFGGKTKISFSLDVSWSSKVVSLKSLITDAEIDPRIEGGAVITQCKLFYRGKDYLSWSGDLQTTYSVHDITFMSVSKYLRT